MKSTLKKKMPEVIITSGIFNDFNILNELSAND